MSTRLFQGIIHQMRDAVDRIIGVVDDNGVIIACSELVKIGEMRQGVRDELAYTSDAITSGGYTYKPIGSGSKWEYIVFIEGEDKYAEKIATILGKDADAAAWGVKHDEFLQMFYKWNFDSDRCSYQSW